MISGLFLASSLVVIMTPGPDTALVSQIVLRFGRRSPALAASAGMITAGCGHALISISGASLLNATSVLFTALRLAGAAVLVGWALWSLRESFRPSPTPTHEKPWRGRAYLVGFLSTATNPKVGLFLLAFLPQFVPTGYPVASTMTLLAAVYLSIASLWMCVLVELIYRLRQRMLTPAVIVTLRRVTALIFLALAARFLVAA